MRGDALSESKGAERGKLLAADLKQVLGDLGVEVRAAGRERVVVLRGGLEQLGDAPAVTPPVGADLAVKVFDGEDVVVGQQDVARNRRGRDRAERQGAGQDRPAVVGRARGGDQVGVRQGAGLGESLTARIKAVMLPGSCGTAR